MAVSVTCLFLVAMVRWVGLWCVVPSYPDHSRLLFFSPGFSIILFLWVNQRRFTASLFVVTLAETIGFTGATELCSIGRLFIEIGWESLQTRRNKHKLTTFYKIMHDLAPPYSHILGQKTTMLSGLQIIFRASDQILTYFQTLSFHIPFKH